MHSIFQVENKSRNMLCTYGSFKFAGISVVAEKLKMKMNLKGPVKSHDFDQKNSD